MADSRLSVPPKKSSPVAMILVLLALAVGAALVTWALYPSAPPPPPRRPAPPPRPSTALVDVPVDTPVAPPVEQTDDAGASGDADVSEPESPAAKRLGKRRRPMPEGKIDKRRLQAFIRAKSGQVRQCYERRLKANNLLQGVLVPQIRIYPDGHVTNVSFAQDTLHDSQVRSCVSRVISGWRFPRPEGGAVTVAYPYRFSPRHD